ncbi:hypothetical protein C2E23DRAFT_739993 [Lenzites betulinus]|nr:hypothetical protein C2E23DRAFT_739993 [Lenzites betulinus]
MQRSCRLLCAHAKDVLCSDRDRLLYHYVPDVCALITVLVRTRAVIGGFAALSYILRDPSLCPTNLDIFVPMSTGNLLVQLLHEDHNQHLQIVPPSPHPLPRPAITRAVIARTTTFVCRSTGRTISIFSSSSETALEPIASAPVTALVNWLSPHTFGCGYPVLTLNRRSIVRLPLGFDLSLIRIFTHLARHDFSVKVEPHRWADWGCRVSPSQTAWQQPCLRTWYLCPDQGRFFGDPGSLVTTYDLLGTDLHNLRLLHQAPYGVAVAWRLWTIRPCTSLCTLRDPFLPQNVTVLPVIVIEQTLQLRVMI